MKTKIDRMKHSQLFTKRTLALVLCFVILISAIGAGTMISAVTGARDVASESDSAASSKIPAADADGDTDAGTMADSVTRNKADIAPAGANADLADTGATYYLLLSYNNNNPTNMTKTVSSSSATFSVTPSSFGKTSWETGINYYVGIASDTSYTHMYSQNGSSAKGTVSGSITAGTQDYTIDTTTYHFAYFTVTNTSGVQSVTVSVAGGDNTTYSFTAVNAVYSISYGSTSNGTLPSTPTSATVGTTVQFKVTPATGYQVSSVTYTPSGGSATACTLVSGTTYKFTMPAKNVTINATFGKASYAVTADGTHCTVSLTGSSPYQYGSSVNFSITPEPNYALKSLTVKQGTSNVSYTSSGSNYSFTMPAGAVAITATCVSTSANVTVYFKSATAYVYHPYISVNGKDEVKMTVDRYLTNADNVNKPKSQTGSLRYAWYKAELTGVDLTSAASILVRAQDTYMEAVGTFTLEENGEIYLACDNLMEGSTLVDISDLSSNLDELDFYDTPLNMIDD